MDFEVPECAASAEDARTFVVDGVGELVVRFTGDEQAHDRRYKLQPLDVAELPPGAGPDAVANVEEVGGAVRVDPHVLGVCGAAPRGGFRMRAEHHRFAVWPGRWRIHGIELGRIEVDIQLWPARLDVRGLEDPGIDVDVKPDVATEVVVP